MSRSHVARPNNGRRPQPRQQQPRQQQRRHQGDLGNVLDEVDLNQLRILGVIALTETSNRGLKSLDDERLELVDGDVSQYLLLGGPLRIAKRKIENILNRLYGPWGR